MRPTFAPAARTSGGAAAGAARASAAAARCAAAAPLRPDLQQRGDSLASSSGLSSSSSGAFASISSSTFGHRAGRRGAAAPARAIEPYMADKLGAAEATFRELQLRMADPDVAANSGEFQKVAKAAADLEATVAAYRAHQDAERQLAEAQRYLKDEAASDPDLAEFAREEIAELEATIADLEGRLKLLLLPKDPLDERSVMLEIRAGAGGDEAGIWAGDLLRMYQRYAGAQGWKATLLSTAVADAGGYKEVILQVRARARVCGRGCVSLGKCVLCVCAAARGRRGWDRRHGRPEQNLNITSNTPNQQRKHNTIKTTNNTTFQITGDSVYSKLKWEAGVHRVQRVPATEAAGRVHTSTATVAVMPEVDDVDVTLDMRDVDVKFAR